MASAGILFLATFLGVFCSGGQAELIPSDAAKTSPAEARQFVDMICPGQAIAMGCSNCPAETSSGDSGARWKVRTITFGHFLGANSEDALVSGSGCEDHADGYSGAYLLTKQGSSWRKVWYAPAEKAEDCKKLSGSDGRDLLVWGKTYLTHPSFYDIL